MPSTSRRHRGGCSSGGIGDRKSTRLNSSHMSISYAVFCLKKKKKNYNRNAFMSALQDQYPLGVLVLRLGMLYEYVPSFRPFLGLSPYLLSLISYRLLLRS